MEKIFCFKVMDFTLPLISKGAAINDIYTETFLTVQDATENKAREQIGRVIEPGNIIIKPSIIISNYDLISAQIYFGKKHCFRTVGKISQVKTEFFEQQAKRVVSFSIGESVKLYTILIRRNFKKGTDILDNFIVKNCELR